MKTEGRYSDYVFCYDKLEGLLDCQRILRGILYDNTVEDVYAIDHEMSRCYKIMKTYQGKLTALFKA